MPQSSLSHAARRAMARGLGAASVTGSKLRLAYAALVLFTMLLYVRLQDLFPDFFADLQVMKIIGIPAVIIYIFAKLNHDGRLSIWTRELQLLLFIYLLGWVFMPIAVVPDRSYTTLTEDFLKVLIIFIMMINLINRLDRLQLLVQGVVLCGVLLSYGAIRSYLNGEFVKDATRIEGMVGGIFGNPNDLATALDLLIPLAIVLALTRTGLWCIINALSVGVMGVAVLMTYSRGGFLGLATSCGLLIMRLGRQSRAKTAGLVGLAMIILLLAMPSGYGGRLSTIFNNNEDVTGSAQERKLILRQAVNLAIRHPLIGIGMSNFPIYSIRERVAHNSYAEIAAELGWLGFAAYLALIIGAVKSCRRIEEATRPPEEPEPRDAKRPAGRGRDASRPSEIYYWSVGLEATLVAYIVCSFFTSIEYQWYLYYPLAYVVALRRIHATENSEVPLVVEKARGALWKTVKPGTGWKKRLPGRKKASGQAVGRLFAR